MTFLHKLRLRFADNTTVKRSHRAPVKKLQYGRRKNMVDYRDQF
jgi:hypothetical protein